MKVALVGFGRIAPFHVAVLAGQGATLCGAVSRSAAGRERALAGGVARAYPSIAELMEREQPDAVVCCPSIDQVFACAAELIPHGVPVLLEKPPGLSLGELDQLIALAGRHATPVVMGLNRRYYSVLRRALEDAGGPDAVTAVWIDWSEDPGALRARGVPDAQIARWIHGNSLHALDLLVTLAGDLAAPHVVTRDLGGFRRHMALSGVGARGALATFQSTWDSPTRWRLVFHARGRRYTFAPLESCTVDEAGRESRSIPPDEHDARFKHGFWPQAAALLEAVRTRTVPDAMSLVSARPAMRLADVLTAAF